MVSAVAAPAVDEAAVRAALADVADPEIPAISIVDLGIVERVEVAERRDPGRPAADVRRLPGARRDQFGGRGAAGRLRAPGRGALRLLRAVDDRPHHGTGTAPSREVRVSPRRATTRARTAVRPTSRLRTCSARPNAARFATAGRAASPSRRSSWCNPPVAWRVDLVDMFRGQTLVSRRCVAHIDREAAWTRLAARSVDHVDGNDRSTAIPSKTVERVDIRARATAARRRPPICHHRSRAGSRHGCCVFPAPASAGYERGSTRFRGGIGAWRG